jgi:toxin ParE1/3/4
VTRIEFAPEVREDFDRILDHLGKYDVENRAARIDEIIGAIGVLERNPQIGRPASSQMHELVIGRDTHGYVALYRYVAAIDTVFVLAVRSQPEAGYVRE